MGLIRIERDHRFIADKIKETMENYDFYKKITLESSQENDWSIVVDKMLNTYNTETNK